MTSTPEGATTDANVAEAAAAQTSRLERRIDEAVDELRVACRTGNVSIEFINGMEAAAALIGCEWTGPHRCVAGLQRNHDRVDDRPEMNT